MRPVYRITVLALMALAACTRRPDAPPLAPQTIGTAAIAGLSAPVTVIRDRWGIPHIYAATATDLFIAQGFVQAEDRLFQMDLWRRASLGRLAEVLGSNFIDRDVMTRRMQYRGDMAAEWSSYAPDARAIAEAFTRGVNAWVARAHDRLPEEFVLAGWTPAFWAPADLLSRTDAFLASGDALDEARRAGYGDAVVNAIREVGTAPFFLTLATPPSGRKDSVPSIYASAPDAATVTFAGRPRAAFAADGTFAVEEAPPLLEAPARRYVVHLHAPGWNVAGIAAPWLPGVVAGHNERIAWGSVPMVADTQDVSRQRVTPADIVRAEDAIRIKGRPQLLTFQRDDTPRGVVIATDTAHQSVFALRWSGFEPGTAGELAALALDRAQSRDDIRAALSRWRLPARRFVYATIDGASGFQDAALIPRRVRGEWIGWLSPDELERGSNDGPVDAYGSDPPVAAAAERANFVHVLAISPEARRRFNVGPIARPALSSPTRARFDLRDWDRSQVIVAPGASMSVNSGHYADLASAWAKGEMMPLLFSDEAVRKAASQTLTLIPR